MSLLSFAKHLMRNRCSCSAVTMATAWLTPSFSATLRGDGARSGTVRADAASKIALVDSRQRGRRHDPAADAGERREREHVWQRQHELVRQIHSHRLSEVLQ